MSKWKNSKAWTPRIVEVGNAPSATPVVPPVVTPEAVSDNVLTVDRVYLQAPLRIPNAQKYESNYMAFDIIQLLADGGVIIEHLGIRYMIPVSNIAGIRCK